jgi:TFIIF-interacting CTD phosphatase-like protein
MWPEQGTEMGVLSQPRRIVILDLDETLVKTFPDGLRPPPNLPESAKSRMYNLNFFGDTAWGLKRPYTDEFLNYCHNRFDKVGVWTAGTAEYAHQIVKKVFTQGFQPDLIYSRQHCANDQYGLFKPLDKLYSAHGFDPSEVLMVDNNHTVIPEQHRDNLIHIPDYEPHPLRPDNDSSLHELMEWMKAEPLTQDVRAVDKTTIFKTSLPTLRR